MPQTRQTNGAAAATPVDSPCQYRPIVDPSRCEAKADCVDVCPLNVFEIIPMPDETYRGLGLMAKLKARVHGMKMAGTPRADACLACAKCVAACPEQAITLTRSRPGNSA